MVLDEISKHHTWLFSFETMQELTDVIFRKKFDKHVRQSSREDFIEELIASSEEIIVTETIVACKDPKDDKFLEAAVSGNADIIITGDGFLKELHPFRGIQILSPAEFLDKYK
ncbi:MAG: putative toxin-antitoxin system toxin component, PIN family [Ignavibacteriota bacterium]